jgi:putative PIN family toxin of toxin-antitoxin system
MLRVVVDTNLIVRAAIMPGGSVGPILKRLRDRDYIYLYSRETLQEVADVLSRRRIRLKYRLAAEDVSTVLQLLVLRGEMITPQRHFHLCRDPKDNIFLDVAIAGAADLLASGDDDLLCLESIQGIPIMGARAFLERLE